MLFSLKQEAPASIGGGTFTEVKADCVWHEKQQAELKEAAMPLVKYLRTHCTPMHVAIVDVAGVDLYAKDINMPIIV